MYNAIMKSNNTKIKKTFKQFMDLLGVFSLLFIYSTAVASIHIVAAENFYGDVANQLGAPYVEVTSIMNNPNQDPHVFNASPKMAVLIDEAGIVIENGVGYDNWMDRLYASSNKKAVLINIGELTNKKSGMNPHIWYDPETMPVFAKKFTEELILIDSEHKVIYEKNLADFLKSSEKYQTAISQARKKLAGITVTVTATEPVLGYLVDALGLTMINQRFQQDIMNEADLTPKEIIAFEESLKNKSKVKLLIYNAQVTDPTTDNLKKLALNNHIPVLGVSETMPANAHYYEWMNDTLEKLEKILL